jgi:hypothetical protein
MVTGSFIEWTRTGRGMLAMAMINLVSLAALFAVIYEWRQDRLDGEARDEATRVQIQQWMAQDIYAPTALEVRIGPTMAQTWVTEKPLLDGARIRASFGGTWVTRLRDATTDSLLCTMPQTGPRWSPYQDSAPRHLSMSWQDYTGDYGSCFAQMQPCGRYDLTTIRQAETVIDGIEVKRLLPNVQSEPFVFPCGGEE